MTGPYSKCKCPPGLKANIKREKSSKGTDDWLSTSSSAELAGGTSVASWETLVSQEMGKWRKIVQEQIIKVVLQQVAA
jgi:hypothetical protein